MGRPPTVEARDLPLSLSNTNGAPTGDSIAEIERAHIDTVLRRMEGNVTRAAEVLKIDRATLYNKIKKYGLRR